MKNDKLLQTRADDAVLKKLGEIEKILGTKNRSATIRRSIEITEMMAKYIKRGDSLIIKRKNGDQIELLIPWQIG